VKSIGFGVPNSIWSNLGGENLSCAIAGYTFAPPAGQLINYTQVYPQNAD